ncbi:HAD hydrolase family protein [Thiohalocapsa sp.]|uniref:HAD hydrolase family protein n=1 Tax=Thiohalocapsa sp. TaxID=2497641 RepID=UPI0025EDFA85|nr:HAD hydrolase family protein [Thiohalocapsa sp.]
MYKLVVSDLDGTLLGPDHRLGDYTRGVLTRVRAAGADLVLASGRHFMDIRVLARLLAEPAGDQAGQRSDERPRGSGVPSAIDSADDDRERSPGTGAAQGQTECLISCNGAAVNTADGQLLQATCLGREPLGFLLRDPLFRDVHTNVFLTDAWLVEQAEPSLLRYHQDSGFRYQVADFARLDGPDGPNVLKVFYYGEHDHLVALEAEILARHGDALGTTFSLPQTLEVMAAGVSKGAALARLLADIGLTSADVVCYGDGLNDLEMLQLIADGGGLALLMDNADARLHAALPHLPRAGGHADEAVARHLEGLLADGLLGGR